MMIGLYLLLNAAVLVAVARASAESGWRLIGMLLLLGFVAGLANNMLEAVIFGVMSAKEAIAATLMALPLFAVLSVVAVFLAGRWSRGSGAEAGAPFDPVLLIAIVVAYELLYWTAGTLVYPYIADFYATRGLPPTGLVAATQVVRSLIFVAAAYPLLRSGLRNAPLMLALVYGIIAGIAPLLPDNPYLPADIRFYHAIEVSVSNTIFGLFVGYLFTRRRAPVQA